MGVGGLRVSRFASVHQVGLTRVNSARWCDPLAGNELRRHAQVDVFTSGGTPSQVVSPSFRGGETNESLTRLAAGEEGWWSRLFDTAARSIYRRPPSHSY